MVNFYVETIAPPKEEYEKLKTAKDNLALGADYYTTSRSLDIMQSLANNKGAGGLATAGAGLGMGLGFASQASGMLNNVGGAMNIAPNGSAMKIQPAGSSANGGEACPHCGATNPAGQKFCGSCGKSMVIGVTCPSCGKVNPTGQSFCGDCGTKLVKKCSACGKENELSQKFCGDCGKPL